MLAEIMAGNASEAQIAAFLIALRTKGETVDELAGLAATMRALRDAGAPRRATTCSTPPAPAAGGATFNVSTTAALIAAGAGCAVAKHGNRSATGLSGSADVLEALGARIDLAPEGVARCIDEAGFGFMFAPAHHPATRHVVPVRKELGGAHDLQLPRPADQPGRRARARSSASPTPRTLDSIAGALARLGHRPGAGSVQRRRPGRAEHVRPDTRGRGRRREQLRRYVVEPEECRARRGPLRGRRRRRRRRTTPRSCARSSPASPVRARDLALLNAGAAIYAAGRADSHRRRRRGRAGRGIDAAPPRRRSTRYVATRPKSWPARREHARAHRRGHARGGRSAAVARSRSPTLERGLTPRAAESGRSPRRSPRPGISVIAEFKRRSPTAGDIRAGATVEEIVGAYERGGAPRCRCSPRARLRRLARRPARRARRVRAADPAQGLHRRPLPGRTRPRPPAPTPCC